MKTPTVCVIQHVAPETAGALGRELRKAGLAVETVHVYRHEAVPRRIGAHAGLVLLGGPMSVYDADRHPFLHEEMRLIENALARERPVLGICLGCQLLAAAAGAAVVRGPRPEIGWHDVHLTRAAVKDPLWHGLPAQFRPLHWHGDTFQLPTGATSLAWSRLTECQAFHFGTGAYGMLFHLEVNEAAVSRMARHFRDEMLGAGQREADVIKVASRNVPVIEPIGRAVFQRWAALLAPVGTPHCSRE